MAALYSLLAEVNLLTQSEIDSYYDEGTRLPALPPFNTIKEIPFATGSLGYGLSVSAGMALGAARIAKIGGFSASLPTASSTRAASGKRPSSLPITN